MGGVCVQESCSRRIEREVETVTEVEEERCVEDMLRFG